MIHEANNANIAAGAEKSFSVPAGKTRDKDADFAATVCIGADTDSGESNYPSVAVPTGKVVKLVWGENI